MTKNKTQNFTCFLFLLQEKVANLIHEAPNYQ